MRIVFHPIHHPTLAALWRLIMVDGVTILAAWRRTSTAFLSTS
jgi:hypothetical protein